jgi:heme/copper-type cytochrome/quinol oxidase subunit 2
MFAHQMRSEQPANATTPQQATGNQQLEDAMLFVAAFASVRALIVVVVIFPFLAMFAQQMRNKQAANASTPQQAAGNQQFEDAVLLVAVLAFAKVLVRLFTATFAQQTREQ